MGWSRREFIAGMGVVAGASAGYLFQRSSAAAPIVNVIRPPGAKPEAEFLAACIRCGQCVEACPFDSIRLAVGAGFGSANGTPYVSTRDVPCYLCQGYDDLECIVACPTNALQPVGDPRAIRMGLAVIDEKACLAFNGTICRSCWHACPFPNEAIRFDAMLRPVVEAETCVGCGLCDHACPTDPTSIPVQPPRAVRESPEGGGA